MSYKVCKDGKGSNYNYFLFISKPEVSKQTEYKLGLIYL